MTRRVRCFTLREHPLEEHCKYLRDLGLRGWTDERPLPVEKLVEVKTVFKIVLDTDRPVGFGKVVPTVLNV